MTVKWKKWLTFIGTMVVLVIWGGMNAWAAQTAPSEFIHITSCQIENSNQIVIRGQQEGSWSDSSLYDNYLYLFEMKPYQRSLEGRTDYCAWITKGDDIVFLRKIVRGGADKSYGIQVAKLAGVPDTVIERAKELVEELTNADITEKIQEISVENGKKPRTRKYDQVDMDQMSLLDTVKDEDVLKELLDLDVGNLTPIDALNTIYRLQNKLKNRW